jgi:hypothetical protein
MQEVVSSPLRADRVSSVAEGRPQRNGERIEEQVTAFDHGAVPRNDERGPTG